MKKQLIVGVIFVMIVATIPLAAGQLTADETIVSENIEPKTIIGVTFIAGLIINPEKLGDIVTAKTLILIYYDRGLIFKDIGITGALKNVRFRDGDLLYMGEPNQYGVTQVVGICTGFNLGF